MIRAVFPGERRLWLWSLVVAVPMLALIVYSLAIPRPYYTGTNSVSVRSVVATLPQGHRLCVPNISIPGGTGGVQIAYAAGGPTRHVAATITVAGRVTAHGELPFSPPAASVGALTIPLTAPLPSAPQARTGTVCISTGRGFPLAIGGFLGRPANVSAPTVSGHAIPGDAAVWFVPPHGRERSLLASWPAIMRRLTLFRPGFAGDVFYWLLFVLGLPLLGYFAVRTLAVATEPGRRLVISLAVIGFATAAVWAITTVPFDSPDESEHFAYTESIAETGRASDAAPSSRPPYATDETFALDAVHHFSVIEIGDTRPPWFAQDENTYRRRIAQLHPSRSDGGGFSVATQAHSPLYYSLLVPGYEAGHSGGVFSELLWMRLISALLSAVVVVAAFGTLRELVRSRPEIAVAGALLIAFQPMFGFIGGAVNNDNGVNALAALAVYLTVRALRRGLSWRLGLALGVTAALLPIIKGTGLAVLPAVGVALVGLIVVRRSRETLLGVASAVAGFAAVGVIWGIAASAFHRSAGGTASGASVAAGALGGKLAYLWEVFLPRLPFMAPHWPSGMWPFMFIYVQRGFAAFGWYADFFPQWVYDVVVATMISFGLLTLAMVVRRRSAVRRQWVAVVFLVLVILGVVAGVEFAFYTVAPRPKFLTPEQGRYAFTAIVPLVALSVGGLLLLPRRWAQAMGAAAVGAMICFAFASHLLYLTQNFT